MYTGEELIARYYVPTTGVGNVWHVFDFDATTGTMIPVNTFSDCHDVSQVGTQ